MTDPPTAGGPAVGPTGRAAPGRRQRRAAAKPRSRRRRQLRRLALTLLALLVLGFVGYLYFLSGLQEARAQTHPVREPARRARLATRRPGR